MKRFGLSLAIAAALGLTACGGSSSSSSGGSTSTTVSGTASKGIVIDGLVEGFLFGADGLPDFSTVIDSDTTDANGDYSLTIPSQYKDEPLYIRVTSDGTATMKCDLAGDDSCGAGVNFGDTYTLADTDFSMGAVLSESDGSVSVGLTPLTTAAAKKALESIETSGSDFGAAMLIEQANSSVANTLNDILGLTGADAVVSITDVAVVDLTNPTEVADSLGDSDTAVQTAAINAAAVSAVQADNPGASIEDAIDSFTDDLADTALVGNTASAGVTDLAEILEDAEAVLGEVDAGDEGEALAAATGDIGTQQDEAETEAPDVAVDDTPSATAGAEELAQVKAFVEELRELGTTIDGKMVGTGEDEDTVENILDNFDLQVDAADMASSDDADAAMEALGEAVQSIVDVFDANFEVGANGPVLLEESIIDGFPIDVESAETGLIVNISQSGGVFAFRVNDDAVDVTIDEQVTSADVDVSATATALTLDDGIVETETGSVETEGGLVETEVGTLTGVADLNIAGTVQAGTIDLELLNGTVTANLVVVVDNEDTNMGSGNSDSKDESFTLTGFELDLDVTMAQIVGGAITTENAMSFAGGLDISVSSVAVTEDASSENDWSGESDTFSENGVQTLKLGIVGIELTGTFGNAKEEFDASFSLTGNASNVPTFTEIYDESFDGSVFTNSESESGGETNSLFAAVTAELTFDAKLAGVADEIQFSFSVTRAGFDDLESSVSLSYPGRSILIEAEATGLDSDGNALASVMLSNNDGVVIQLDADESTVDEDDELTGTITITGSDTVYATLDVVDGMELIRYSDGTFESAF